MTEHDCTAWNGGISEDDAPDCGHEHCETEYIDARRDAIEAGARARRTW